MKEKKREKKEARWFKRYIGLRRQASLNQMIDFMNYKLDESIIALEMRFPKYSEAYVRI